MIVCVRVWCRDWGGLSRDTSASMHNDIPALSLSKVPGGKPKATVPFRTQCYRTTDSIDDSGAHLRLYFLQCAALLTHTLTPSLVHTHAHLVCAALAGRLSL